jgi:5-formyltetrahydrofolate cyclo-ligase
MAPDPAKAALRAELRAARDMFLLDLPSGERGRLEREAAAHLLPLIEGARRVAFYVAHGSELDCAPAIDAAAIRGIDVALPFVSGSDQSMLFLRWKPGEALEPGWRRLLQPRPDSPEIVPDIIVAPLLGFDSAGWRIGQGAGFYDRAFAMHPKVKKIGLGWSVQQRPAIAHDSWDVPLDLVVTEAGVIRRT